MSLVAQRYYRGQGRLSLYKRTAAGKLYEGVFVGNCPELSTRVETEQTTHTESYTGQRYTDLRFTSKRMAVMSAVFESFLSENLARSFYGINQNIASSTASAESKSASKGFQVKLDRINITAITSVTGIGGTPVYQAGTDYTVDLKSGTLTIPATSTIPDAVAAADNILINYSFGSSERIKMLATNTIERALVFEGLNTAEGDKPVVLTAWRVSIDHAQQIEWINNANEVTSFPVEMEVLYDVLQADPENRFFMVEQTVQA
jgi:hypothetical protein